MSRKARAQLTTLHTLPRASAHAHLQAEQRRAAACLQPPLRCVATRERDGRTPSKLPRASREVPGNRPLRHPGAPTQTCYGVIQGAQLWGQWATSEKPLLASDSGRRHRRNTGAGALDGPESGRCHRGC
jgi:hypothetical protein